MDYFVKEFGRVIVTYIHAHTYTHEYIHTYIHTYIYTYIQICMDYFVKEFGRVIVTEAFATLGQQSPTLCKEMLAYAATHLVFSLR